LLLWPEFIGGVETQGFELSLHTGRVRGQLQGCDCKNTATMTQAGQPALRPLQFSLISIV